MLLGSLSQRTRMQDLSESRPVATDSLKLELWSLAGSILIPAFASHNQ
jgi:hypothetical protein